VPLVRALLKPFHNMRAALHIPDQPPNTLPPASGPGCNDAFGLLSAMLLNAPPAFPTGRPKAPDPGAPLRRSQTPSCAGCPDRATPRYAEPRAAAAGSRGGLGEPPALRASSGRRWRRAVAAAGRKSGFVFPACDVCPGYARRVPDAVCMRPNSPFLEYYPLEQSKRWVNDVEVSECLSGTGGLDHFGPARSNLSGMR
jgi:hypothetical protein